MLTNNPMIATGQVLGGQVVLDNPISVPDGSVVRVEVVDLTVNEVVGPYTPTAKKTLRERLKNFLSHPIDDLPPDAAENHDYYLIHGLPVRH